MRKSILLFVALFASQLHAQIKLKINDKLVSETTITKIEEINKIEVAFDKFKSLDYYGLGRLYLFVQLLDEEGKSCGDYVITKDGSNAIKFFLEDTNTFYNITTDKNPRTDFSSYDSRGAVSLTDKLENMVKYRDKSRMVKISISLSYRDKIGYEKYGDTVFLIKPQMFTIDNTYLFNEGQKKKAEEKIASDAKKAEDDKKAEEAKKQRKKKRKRAKEKNYSRKY
ncbi:hypothetical protein [Flavobacterium phycosphaerae]|uniref:hypothetical protein n=1 Tax=Flavobacterium phycosphaerae TaxID=2697515 RepID=UPI0013896A03|nr:hypothetical protein [Flavobacterium phycosphaerae]